MGDMADTGAVLALAMPNACRRVWSSIAAGNTFLAALLVWDTNRGDSDAFMGSVFGIWLLSSWEDVVRSTFIPLCLVNDANDA